MAGPGQKAFDGSAQGHKRSILALFAGLTVAYQVACQVFMWR
eukprot:CAMPEP_0168407010 /NCGR_PEP_ID=MMETSP0228-20121227/25943_1 /TAXON_ID=133427 /ORGANISM="Protoceratium reticulatum, Strain CCCM 535 (=CCMP 1889)" /LENGTH=41 /DNA_ID= /DNA_START= /DNA_END= /DNA_ORIENTATION=